jgi:hypothetical protein
MCRRLPSWPIVGTRHVDTTGRGVGRCLKAVKQQRQGIRPTNAVLKADVTLATPTASHESDGGMEAKGLGPARSVRQFVAGLTIFYAARHHEFSMPPIRCGRRTGPEAFGRVSSCISSLVRP